jgi:activator of (R)-2-hydroxyglutaryl-coA dehydratase
MYTLGLDIGSTTSKSVILEDGERIVAQALSVGGLGTSGPEEVMSELIERSELTESDISCTVVTGYGRNKYKGCDLEVSELTCHALGSQIIFPDVRTVIDIGGQDAKVICLNESGRMTNFVMNDKCAAGTGRFLDVMANILRADISELELLASKAEYPATISSTCTVFAESEVISQLANGESRENVIAGICNSVASRVSALARRAGIKEKVCMSGGVAKNGAVRNAMSNALEVEIEYDPLAQYFGAIGAAVYAFKNVINKEKQ